MKITLTSAVILVIGLVLGVVIGNGASSGLFGFLSGGMTHNSTTILESIRDMAHLTAVRYNYSSLITTQRDMPGLLAALYGEQLLMVAVGHVDAGIDLSQLTEENVSVQDDKLTVTLPEPELTNCILNEQQSYVVSQSSGIFARNAPNMDTEARRYAVRIFRDMALEARILDDVYSRANDILTPLIDAISGNSFKVIQINMRPPSANAPLPETCQ